MKLAIVGSVDLSGNMDALLLIEQILEDLKPELVISGGAEGVDKMAEDAAIEAGIPTQIFYPTKKNWPAYKARNLKIAKACDMLIRIKSSHTKTYGSGWTRDRAAEMDKPTKEFVIQYE